MPVKAGVIRAAARTTRRGAAETFTGVVFQDPVITAEAPSRHERLKHNIENLVCLHSVIRGGNSG
jgi:hypothetical protein